MEPIFKNSDKLLEDASKGELVLFLGAGINVGCKMGDPPLDAPLGNTLPADISNHFFPEEPYTGESLRSVSGKIQKIKTDKKLREYLAKRLHPVELSNALSLVPLIKWKSIYTVNIDYGIETAYAKISDKVQNIHPIILPNDPVAADIDMELPYYKLHGCLMNNESNVIFSHRDYTKAREKNLRLFAHLTVTLCESSLLFIGFGFEDSDFFDLWESVKDYGGSSSKFRTHYLVKPSPLPSYIESMEIDGVTVIDSKSEDFLPWLKANLHKTPVSIANKIVERSASITRWAQEQYSVSLPPNIADSLKKTCQIVSELKSPVRLPENSNYLKGAQPFWDDIQNGLLIKREIQEDLIEDIHDWERSKKPKISLLLGAAGFGKTSVLMQTAYDISKENGPIVLWARQNTEFNPIAVAEFCAFLKQPAILFIDDGPKYMAAIRKLHFDAVSHKIQLYIIVGARPSEWNSARGTSSLSILSTFRLQRLSENEIRNLSITLKKSGLLKEKNENLTIDEIQEHFVNVGENHIIAGLRTVLFGNDTKFNEIIADEYYRIQNEIARKIYLSVALSHSLGIFMPAALASRLTELPIIDYHTKIELYLEDIVLEDSDKISGDLLFFTQHRVIAESLLESVADPESIIQLLQRISKAVNPHSFNEYKLLTRIYDEDYLGTTLKETGRIRSFYKYLMEEFPADPYIKQHAAIFESKDKQFDTARNLADEAIKLGDRHPHFLNTKGTIWLREAIDESKPDRAEYALKQGVSLIRERISKDADKEIHYHSLIDKLLDWAIRKPHLSEEQRLRALEEAQADLDDALRLYPMSSELSTLMGRLNIGIERIPEAEDRLKRSIYLDAGNIRAILLLASLLIKKGEDDIALTYLNDGMSYAPKSSGLLRLKLKCLIRLNKSWDEQKRVYLEYLRLTQDDYSKRIVFIKGLIEHGDYTTAARQIKTIKDSTISFHNKLNLRADLNSEDGSPMIVSGTYTSYRLGKGFIAIQGFPRNLDAHLQLSTISNRSYPRDGEILKIEIAVNGLGIHVKKMVS
ncbi:MAG: SIR2 family protein [Proteobacteria bacterium]|nr:SIR2 family protein [Pseudomonadota bacterium]MBU1585204.1 SIR2 family protein [Pseudomonadota bacterium]MBU2454517.1 SIR2 family protein [Pseudomonadota bacterium]MBU2629094.1 SIR2 family protein [Pseudomonadota bacterium]